MPTYLYECPNCGEMEIVRKITDDQLTICPICQSTEDHFIQLISPIAGVIFKGSGFYCNDYCKHNKINKETNND